MQEPVVIPEVGFLKIWQIVGDRKRNVAPLLPISKSAFWAGVRSGKYPAGTLLSARCRVWSAASVRKLLSDLQATEGGAQ